MAMQFADCSCEKTSGNGNDARATAPSPQLVSDVACAAKVLPEGLGIVTMRRAGRIPSLDGLRALSIILVILSHVRVTENFPQSFALIGTWGSMGVRIFFVISGYLITSLLIDEEQRTQRVSLKGFYVRRAFRILPAFWTFLCGTWLLDQLCDWHLHANSYWAALTFTMYLWRGATNWQLGHVWSLSIEEQFYLLWPLIFARSRRTLRMAICLTVIAIAPLIRTLLMIAGKGGVIAYSIVGQADFLMYGAFLALAVSHSPSVVKAVVSRAVTISRISATIALFGSEFLARMVDGWYEALPVIFSFQGVLIAYLIASFTIVERGIAYWLLNVRPVVLIGLWSYSLYLWQELFLCPAELTPIAWFQRYPQNLCFAVGAGMASYYLIETPFLHMRRHLERRHRVLAVKSAC